MEFAIWDELVASWGALVEDGKAILRSHSANIEKFIADAYVDTINGHMVPIVNVPYHYASDTAHALLQKYPEAPFTACWFRRGDGMIQYSLRSEDSRKDVSAIAKSFGGGGHRNAAGYQVRA
jgi:nanoRNase/pAp phosphatase (c-di-AMP/oligoRNAs hydrolase)